MIRLFLALSFVVVVLNAKSDIDTKISNVSSKLDKSAKVQDSISKKMEENARAILKQKKEILKQQKYLQELIKELSEKESSYKENISKLKELKVTQQNLKKEQEDIEEELVFTIAQSVSLSVILEEEYTVGEQSLIEYEVLQALQKLSKAKANELNEKFFSNSKNINLLNTQASSLESAIANIESKRRDVVKIQEENKLALEKLKKDKDSYKKELKKILEKKDALKRTLSELNIIKIDEIKKAKEEKARREAFRAKQLKDDKNLPKVKKHGSSYQKAKTKNYRGKKTIAPLDSYTITKKYGTYTDPVYGIKIFNESISLKPKEVNAKVKTVFNGKVIYADKTAVLDNIVIIEHSDGLHTIYANLSQISPNIKKGKRIKKGYTIGRVKDELIFEVTQKSYHIDPIKLFK